MRSDPPSIDTGMLAARLKRLTGRSGPALAHFTGILPSRFNAISQSKPATHEEKERLVAALERIGGTLNGLLAPSR